MPQTRPLEGHRRTTEHPGSSGIRRAPQREPSPSPLIKTPATAPSCRPPAGRLDFLDSIRGLAALTVMHTHFIAAFMVPSALGFFQSFHRSISLFFVLSGFVLSRKFFAPGPQPEGADSLVHFLGRRWFRIYPPYVVAVLLSFGIQHCLFAWPAMPAPPTDWALVLWQPNIGFADVVKECFFLNPSPEKLLVPQRWTLVIELQFAFLIPFLILIAKRSVLWLAFFAIWVGPSLGMQYYLFSFSLGVLLARFFPAGASPKDLSPRLFYTLLGVGLFFYFGVEWYYPVLRQLGCPPFKYEILNAVGAVLLLATVLYSRKLQSFLNLRALRIFGKYAYGFYLLHMVVIFCVAPGLFSRLGSLGSGAWLLVLSVSILSTLLLAAVFYHVVELPSIHLGRWVMRKLPRFRQF
jgi:peptidoglycan/LPS O-acetylase OafA/YrhL